MKEEYFSTLLLGAEDWAIDQIRNDFAHKDEIINILEKQRNELISNHTVLKELVGDLLHMLETVETSDNETDFSPTTIRSCRIQHTAKLNEIMPKITKIVRSK